MLPENGLSKFTKNHAKIHCQNLFFHWDSRYGPYEEDFVPSFIIFDHCMPFLSTDLFLGQELLTQQKTPFFLQNRLKFNGGVKSEGILNRKILSNVNRIDAMIAKKHDLNCPECFKLELYRQRYTAPVLLSSVDSTNFMTMKYAHGNIGFPSVFSPLIVTFKIRTQQG